MKNKFYVFLTFLLLLSCSSNNENRILPIDDELMVEAGKQVFRVNLKELSKKVSINKQKNLEPAFALVSINDKDGVVIFTREKIVLTKEENSYITAEIALNASTYTLTEFIVVDKNDVVISLSPKENSIFAELASSTLPFDFTVSPDETKETVTENFNVAGYTSVDFGYTGLTLIFPESTNFFSLIVDDSELLTIKTIVLKSLTGSSYVIDWGDGVIENYISTKTEQEEENKLTHIYEKQASYEITISGPIEVIETFSFHGEIPNEIYQYQNNLVSIDIVKLAQLKELSINRGKLASLDISSNKNLEKLTVFGNDLTSLDLTNNSNLIEVAVFDNALTNLDISQNLTLENLNVGENQLTNLEIANNFNLQILTANKNELQELDISNNLKLQYVNVDRNNLTYLDSSKNLGMAILSIGVNQLTTVDVSKNIELKNLSVYENQINDLDISTNTKLESLDANDNFITNLDTSNNLGLRYLTLGNNSLSNIELSNNPNISILHIGDNKLNETSLDQLISQLYDTVMLYSIKEGTLRYSNNPGNENINTNSLTKLNELASSYKWKIYGD